MVKDVIRHDVEAFGNQSSNYKNDPLGETRAAVSALVEQTDYARQYDVFMRDMVYGERPDFSLAITAIENILDRLG